jgi:hypothetical protein
LILSCDKHVSDKIILFSQVVLMGNEWRLWIWNHWSQITQHD